MALNNLAQRFVVASVAIPALLGALYFRQGIIWFVLCLVFARLAAKEFLALVAPDEPESTGYHPLFYLLYGGVFVTLFLAVSRHSLFGLHFEGLLPLLYGGLILAVAVLLSILVFPPLLTQKRLRTGGLVLGPFYLAGPFALLTLIRLYGTSAEGAGLCIFTLAVAWFGDSVAMLFGKTFGGPKLYPTVSPGKTWSGAVGGLIGSASVVLFAKLFFLPSLPVGKGIALALFAGAFGQLGDLCESVLKRTTGVKDSGSSLPGHGGFLDRVDALLFVTLVVFGALQSGWLGFSLPSTR